MVTHSSILAWRIPWTKEPGGLQLQRVRHDLATKHSTGTRSHATAKSLHATKSSHVTAKSLQVATKDFMCSQMLFSHQVVSDSL